MMFFAKLADAEANPLQPVSRAAIFIICPATCSICARISPGAPLRSSVTTSSRLPISTTSWTTGSPSPAA